MMAMRFVMTRFMMPGTGKRYLDPRQKRKTLGDRERKTIKMYEAERVIQFSTGEAGFDIYGAIDCARGAVEHHGPQ